MSNPRLTLSLEVVVEIDARSFVALDYGTVKAVAVSRIRHRLEGAVLLDDGIRLINLTDETPADWGGWGN